MFWLTSRVGATQKFGLASVLFQWLEADCAKNWLICPISALHDVYWILFQWLVLSFTD